ncbi:uncharacterized protein LOC121374504 [Gigantopelta aegis]|uniref:uncharacterized protein LOC121374504 n=1 Tax=Gigantopelta aegis TaxID=1735272 RepID=UPI001B889F89|nr:uncharacterized protein LOC121374504 [Gigantopelta aegis]
MGDELANLKTMGDELANLRWNFVITNNAGTRIPVAVALNRRSMLTIPDEVKNDKRCIKRTINQHDFEQNEIIQKNEHWTVPNRSLPKDQVEREIGNMLADFCSDADVYMLKRDLAARSPASQSRDCQSFCFNCSIEGHQEPGANTQQ